MNRFRKMVLLSKSEYEQLQSNSKSEQGIEKILSDTQYPTNEIKRIHAAHLLNRQLQVPDPVDREQALTFHHSLPKSYRTKGDHLLNILKQKMTWDDQGLIKLHSGSLIHDSNMDDVLHFLVRNRKYVEPPPGWNLILPILRELNLSRELVTNPAAFKSLHTRTIVEQNSSPRKRFRDSPYQVWETTE